MHKSNNHLDDNPQSSHGRAKRDGNSTMGQSSLLSFNQLRAILQKPVETRTNKDLGVMMGILKECEWMEELAGVYGVDLVKNLLKTAKIEQMKERQLIAREQQESRYAAVVLQGRVGIIIGEQRTKVALQCCLQMKNKDITERLMRLAYTEKEASMGNQKRLRRKNSLPTASDFSHPPQLSISQFNSLSQKVTFQIHAPQHYGLAQRLISRTYLDTVIALSDSWLLLLDLDPLMYWFDKTYRAERSKMVGRLKGLPCFNMIHPVEILEQIHFNLTKITKKRGQTIFTEGDAADNIYIMLEGEIRLLKNTSLFVENPNQLYMDRVQLMKKSNKGKYTPPPDVLKFADLTSVYNYRPIQKVLEIGMVSSFCFFGEIQVILNKEREGEREKRRETTAVINSFQATYYQIEFKKLIQILTPKFSTPFLSSLKVTAEKKILYRQIQYADKIQFQNKKNLDYFYYEEEQEAEPRPRKYKIQKINQKMNATAKQWQYQNGNNNRRNNTKANTKSDQRSTTAFYNTFNFDKLINNTHSIATERKGRGKGKMKGKEEVEEDEKEIRYSTLEQNIMGMSHSWNPMQRKVSQEKRISCKISPFKHSINLMTPLIDNEYFKSVERQNRRIDREHRTARFSLSKKK